MTATSGFSLERALRYSRKASPLLFGGVAILGLCAAPARAKEAPLTLDALQGVLAAQELRLKEQQAKIDKAERAIVQQAQLIADERRELAGLRAMTQPDLAIAAGRGAYAPDPAAAAPPVGPAPDGEPQVAQTTTNNQIPVATAATPGAVGEAPPAREVDASVLPMNVNILTAPGHFIVESDASYVETNNNRLVFQGIELVPGVQIGAIAANNTERNLSVVTESVRYGIAPRWEIQLAVPYVYTNDRVTEAVQRDNQITQTTNLRGSGFGDIEVTGRYQITSGQNGWPILVGNLMVKPPTGRGAFDLKYDQFGDALNLPTGSGFWGVEPSISLLYTTDPAVIFANLGYLYQFPSNINKLIGGATVGKVEPGASIDASFGFAFALNQKFSFSLGYQESYIEDTYEYVNGTKQRSYALQVGSLIFGTSYRITDRTTMSANFQFGVTSDAPNVTATFRLPFYF